MGQVIRQGDLSISNIFGCNAAKHQHQFSQGAKTEAERLILSMNSGGTVSVGLGRGESGQHTLRASIAILKHVPNQPRSPLRSFRILTG